jgi:ABC-type lipoprotein release transport system permease subunit
MGGILSLLVYSVRSTLRNKIRSLYAAIGVVLAISLVAGSLMAVDSSVYGLLRSALEPIPVDFSGMDTHTISAIEESAYSAPVAALESVPDVEEVAPFVSISYWMIGSESGGSAANSEMEYKTLVFLGENSSRIIESYGILGDLPAKGKVAISNQTAKNLGLEIGDNIVCSRLLTTESYIDETVMHSTAYLNISFQVSQIWTQRMPADYSGYKRTHTMPDADDVIFDVYPGIISQPIIFNMADASTVVDPMISFDPESAQDIIVSYLVWVDRSRVIDPADIGGTFDRIELIGTHLDREGIKLGIEFDETDLIQPLSLVQSHLEDKKPVLLGISLPVVVLGVFLSFVGVDLGIRHRRQEIGILKSRGASSRQIFGSMIMESVVIGIFAGILGILIGAGLSRFLLNLAVWYSREPGEAFLADLVVQPSTIAAAIILGTLLMMLSAYTPFSRASKIEVAEALHHYSPQTTTIEYRARYDITALSLSLLSIVSVLFFPEVPNYTLSYVAQTGLSFPIWIGHAIVPLVPFLLSFSVVRLLTRGSTKVFVRSASLVKAWTKDLHYIVKKNIERNPRRASNICVIISLALSFGLFVSVTMESSIAYEEELAEFRLGGEVSVTGLDTLSYEPVDINALDEIGRIGGIQHYCVNYVLPGLQETWNYRYVGNAVLNVTAYAETVRLRDSLFVDSDTESLFRLRENGSVLITEKLAESFGLAVGDVVPMRFMHNVNSSAEEIAFSVKIAGFVKGLPGFEYADMFIDRSSLEFLSEQLLLETSTTIVLVDVNENYDEVTIADEVADSLEQVGLRYVDYQVLSQELAKLEKDPSFGALRDFLEMEYVLVLVIMSVGVGLVVFVTITEREQELACIIARGSSGSQMRRILVGESMAVMIFAATVGLSVGLLTAFMYNQLLAEGADSVIDRRIVFAWTTWIILLVSVGSLLSASLLASFRAGRIKLNEILRIRGG